MTLLPTHEPTVDLYYRHEMAISTDPLGNYSRSPSKPTRFVQHVASGPLAGYLTRRDFAPLDPSDFRLAHTVAYVADFFAGRQPRASSNGLAWSPEFAESVRYTNGSLVAAVFGALDRPGRIALSPTSGFHHARPSGGSGFCTFSGQVIAAVRAYRERGARGAWIDLDGHFGNSIEDSRDFVADLDKAIPLYANINPDGRHERYLSSLRGHLDTLGRHVLAGEIDYVCFAHGADSHEWDDLGTQCSTAEWIAASCMVYARIAEWSAALGRPVPVVLALFGGYREDHPESVLELHAADLAIGIAILSGARVSYEPKVRHPQPSNVYCAETGDLLDGPASSALIEASDAAGSTGIVLAWQDADGVWQHAESVHAQTYLKLGEGVQRVYIA